MINFHYLSHITLNPLDWTCHRRERVALVYSLQISLSTFGPLLISLQDGTLMDQQLSIGVPGGAGTVPFCRLFSFDVTSILSYGWVSTNYSYVHALFGIN